MTIWWKKITTIKSDKDNEYGKKKHAEIIQLNCDCFKFICFISKNEIGRELRQYFISLEKIFVLFQNSMVQKRANKIRELDEQSKKSTNLINENKKNKCQ